jgi:hypothetical protein
MPDIIYTPPPTIREFIKWYKPGRLFSGWIIGPYGSGKTTGNFFKLLHMAKLQEPGPDGIRRTRAVVVRNTAPQLRDTTLASWNMWFKHGQAGEWVAGSNKFTLRFDDVECEVLFRALDRPEDVSRVLSLEISFAIIDEFVEIPKAIIDALAGRCGRYPAAKDGGCTNRGIWGASNPSTEDNWWFDYLHNQGEPECLPKETGRYFQQPSGFAPEAENLENLVDGYYTDQAEGKSEAWIHQFLHANWGFSIAGKPVVPTFKSDLHLSKNRIEFNPHLPLIGGFDPGVRNSAMIFGQEDIDGRLMVLGEIIAQGYGADRFDSELMKPYLRRNFPELNVDDFIIAPDPAAGNRTAGDEKTVVDVLKRRYKVSIEQNNRLPLRLDAIEHFTTRLVLGKPAIVIDEKMCPVLSRALKGGWRYALDKNEQVKNNEPEKNAYSHPGDAFGYLCRYYHRQSLRNERYTSVGAKPFVIPKTFGGRAYHVR